MKKDKPECVRLGDLNRDAFFPSGLEYNLPARGMWNIVHTGMIVPEAHEIFACAQGCLRGVILTAAEMFTLDRMSWISVSEEDMFDCTLESDIINGVKEIIRKLGKHPPVVLLYLSCIHLFAGVDFEEIIRELNGTYEDITFVDCYMTPTMRTTVSPVMKMSSRIYGALKKVPMDFNAVGIVGNDRPTDEDSELVKIIRGNGYDLCDITLCKNFSEYQQLSKCFLNITYIPTATLAGDELEKRFGGTHLHIPVRYDFDAIVENYQCLCRALDVDLPDFSDELAAAEKALTEARTVIRNTAVAVDFTAVTRPFEFALLLKRFGFNVRYIIADTAAGEEEAFDALRAADPDITVYSATNVNIMDMPEQKHEPVLAVGQKAAYCFATDNFVNIIVNGGCYGFSGIKKIAGLMKDAYLHPKNRSEVIKLKGWGCASCLV